MRRTISSHPSRKPCGSARAGLHGGVSHHKVAGKRNFGRSEQTLAILAEAARSQPLCLDCHPYPATSTMLRLDRVGQSSRTMITWSKGYPEAGGATFTN